MGSIRFVCMSKWLESDYFDYFDYFSTRKILCMFMAPNIFKYCLKCVARIGIPEWSRTHSSLQNISSKVLFTLGAHCPVHCTLHMASMSYNVVRFVDSLNPYRTRMQMNLVTCRNHLTVISAPRWYSRYVDNSLLSSVFAYQSSHHPPSSPSLNNIVVGPLLSAFRLRAFHDNASARHSFVSVTYFHFNPLVASSVVCIRLTSATHEEKNVLEEPFGFRNIAFIIWFKLKSRKLEIRF